MAISDTEIRCEVRSLVNRQRLDLQRLQIRITNGTLRLGGELAFLGGSSQTPVPAGTVQGLEQDLQRLRGVKHTFLGFADWRRLSSGEWEPVRKRQAPTLIPAGWAGTDPHLR